MVFIHILIFLLFLMVLFVLLSFSRLLQIKTKKQKKIWFGTSLLVLATIFGNDLVTHTYFSISCARTVEGVIEKRKVPGFYAPDFTARDVERFLPEGYEFIETTHPSGGYYRYLRGGQVLVVDRLISGVAYEHYSEPDFLGVEIRGSQVVDIFSRQVLASTGRASTTGGVIHEAFQGLVWGKTVYEVCIFTNIGGDILLAAIPPENKELKR